MAKLDGGGRSELPTPTPKLSVERKNKLSEICDRGLEADRRLVEGRRKFYSLQSPPSNGGQERDSKE